MFCVRPTYQGTSGHLADHPRVDSLKASGPREYAAVCAEHSLLQLGFCATTGVVTAVMCKRPVGPSLQCDRHQLRSSLVHGAAAVFCSTGRMPFYVLEAKKVLKVHLRFVDQAPPIVVKVGFLVKLVQQ